MMEILPDSDDNVLAVKATEKLTSEDYEATFVPEIERRVSEQGKVRVLVYLDENFRGWDLGAAWDDTKFGLSHRKDFEKIAVVGGPKWIEWGVKIGKPLVPGEIKTYDGPELNQAMEWIKA